MKHRKSHLSRREQKKKHLSDYQLTYRYFDKYKHLLSIGYSKEQAVKVLHKDSSMDSVSKLQHRVGVAQHQVGVTGVSLEGVRFTEEVKKYIKELEESNVILPYHKGNDTLRLTKPHVW